MTEAYKYAFLHARAISFLRLFITRVSAVETAEPIERNFALPRRVLWLATGTDQLYTTQPNPLRIIVISTQPLYV